MTTWTAGFGGEVGCTYSDLRDATSYLRLGMGAFAPSSGMDAAWGEVEGLVSTDPAIVAMHSDGGRAWPRCDTGWR